MPKVVVVKPNKKPEVVEIKKGDEFAQIRQLVGGYLTTRSVSRDLTVFCDEDGELRELPANREIGGNVYLGTIVFAKFDNKKGAQGLDAKGINKAIELAR